jgi:hypothetical protein
VDLRAVKGRNNGENWAIAQFQFVGLLCAMQVTVGEACGRR